MIPFSIVLAAIVSRIAATRATAKPRLDLLLFLALLYVCVNKFAYIPLVVLPPAAVLLGGVEASGRRPVRLAAISAVAVALWFGWTALVRHDVLSNRPGVPVSFEDQTPHAASCCITRC